MVRRVPPGYVDAADDMLPTAEVELHPQADWLRLADLLAPLKTAREMPQEARDAILREARAVAGENPTARRLVDRYDTTR
jgi:hypothetical protein